MRRIDSHHHFWSYSPEQYPWISASMGVLKRDFLPEDLFRIAQSSGVESVVSVQARQSIDETYWLLELANDRDWILGVVGWLPLASEKIGSIMESLSDQKKLVALRHVIQDEADDHFMEGADFNRGLAVLKEHDWVYDLLIYGRQLPQAIAMVDRHRDQVFVLDHIAKPTVHRSVMDANWAENIRRLAERPNVLCKFSGVVTEVRDDSWDVETIRPYWDIVVESFGMHRLMFGSDWPVCLLRSEYVTWIDAVEQLVSSYSAREQSDFWFNNAFRTYGHR
jgi:L-fuconolactonase